MNDACNIAGLKTSGASRAISFDRLRHDQIVNPCGSFAGTYTSKYELCKIISRIQPGGCFTLPQDRAALVQSPSPHTLPVDRSDMLTPKTIPDSRHT